MTPLEILVIAVGLALDAFAVCLSVGTTRHARGIRPAFRLAFHCGLFQFVMPVIGWFIGARIAGLVSALGPWVAFALLAFVGIRMKFSGFEAESAERGGDPTRGWNLVLLALATSIDAFAIGLSLAMLRMTVWYPGVVIGVVTASLCLVGLRLGSRLGTRFGRRMELVGGLFLCLIGLHIVLAHFAIL